ncbi:MAG: DUF2203 domain-containing protein [Verrucomicrobiota bacterium]
MNYHFRKHYTRDEARELLPQIREWLEALEQSRRRMEPYDERIGELLDSGCDVGGEVANNWVRILAAMQELLREFESREIQIKDLERGLVDFPALIGDKEVFLCWEKDEDDIEFWHDIDAGYAHRERL